MYDYDAVSLSKWQKRLLCTEIDIIQEAQDADLDDEFTPGEVLEILVDWYGGLSTAYQVKSLISRVYGIEF